MLVANITDEPAHSRVVSERLTHLVLFEFVAGQYGNSRWLEMLECVRDERLAKRSRAAGHENAFPIEAFVAQMFQIL